jgi:hypothetical protein
VKSRLLVGLACALSLTPAKLQAAFDAGHPAALSFAYPASHPVTPLPDEVIERVADAEILVEEFAEKVAVDVASDKPLDPRAGMPRVLSHSGLCGAIAAVAQGYNLPVAFFANLIWQESNFKLNDISRAGALGIAQFMPRTAVGYGLINPFEPIHALNAAATFLRELNARFGNLGLAAAAYNAGPRRVIDWMGKRGALPGETRNYVLRITGQPAAAWIGPDVNGNPEMTLMPAKAPCPEVIEAVREQAVRVRVAKLMIELIQATTPPEPQVGKVGNDDGKATAADEQTDRTARAGRKSGLDRKGDRKAAPHKGKESIVEARPRPGSHRNRRGGRVAAKTGKPAR